MADPLLDRRSLGRALLARQLLLERAELTVEQALTHLVGMQAQAPNPPYLGLWTRLVDFHPDQLSALVLARRAVRLALMRSTIHLVTAADCLTLRPLLQPAVAKGLTPGSPYGRALAGVDRAELAVLGRRLLEEEPRTNGELGPLLGQRWPGVDQHAMVMAVRADVPMVQIPPRGLWGGVGQPRCSTAEVWLGRALDPEPSVDQLVLRYLAAYGPATVRDAQAWSGLTRLGEVVDRLRGRLVVFRDEDGATLFDLPEAPRPGPDVPAPVRLLPEFDNLLLSHADRSRVIDQAAFARVFTQNGIIRGSVLVDGTVAGTWKLTTAKSRAAVAVQPFRALSAAGRSEVQEQAIALLGGMAPAREHDVAILS